MSLEVDLMTYLLAYTGLANLVGARIYPLRLPKEVTYPAITYMRISKPRTYSHSGDSNLSKPRIQFSCFAKTYLAALDVADQIVAALSGFKGSMSQTEIYAAFIQSQADMYEPDTMLYHIPVDVIIHYKG
jgi:hypothetical protein